VSSFASASSTSESRSHHPIPFSALRKRMGVPSDLVYPRSVLGGKFLWQHGRMSQSDPRMEPEARGPRTKQVLRHRRSALQQGHQIPMADEKVLSIQTSDSMPPPGSHRATSKSNSRDPGYGWRAQCPHRHPPEGEREKKLLHGESNACRHQQARSVSVSNPRKRAPWRFRQGPPFGWGASTSPVRFDDGWQPSCGVMFERQQPGSLDARRKLPQISVPREHGV